MPGLKFRECNTIYLTQRSADLEDVSGNTMGGEEDVYEDCLANNYVLLGWGGIDFSNCSTYESVKARIASEKQSLKAPVIIWLP
jgi:hypothetical protein